MEGIRNCTDYNGIGSADSPWWYATEREMPYGLVSDTNGDWKVDRGPPDQRREIRLSGLNTRLRQFIERL